MSIYPLRKVWRHIKEQLATENKVWILNCFYLYRINKRSKDTEYFRMDLQEHGLTQLLWICLGFMFENIWLRYFYLNLNSLI